MVPPVADVDCDLPELCFEHPVPGVSLHVVGGLVEVAHPGDVVLPRPPHELALVRDDHRGVPEDVVAVALQDGRDDHHAVLLGVLFFGIVQSISRFFFKKKFSI